MAKTARRLLVCCVLVFLAFGALASAQRRRQVQQADIRGLINKLEDENEFVAKDASKKLIKIGPTVIAPLIERLKKKKNCDFQFYAAEVIRKIDPRRAIVKSTLVDVARGNCELSEGMHAAIVYFNAASVLVEKIKGGIPLVAQWLADDDVYIRNKAAFAFWGLAELIQQKRLAKTRTKEIISATRAVIPMLAKTLDDEDRIIRCRSYVALWRMQRSGYHELRAEATRALQGITDRCT
jgi:HEAT repeat protein